MESFYFLLLGTVLLFLHPSVYAIAVREMVIEASPADVDSEEIASALALIEAPPADDNIEEIESALALPSAEENEFDSDTQDQVQPFNGAVDDFFIEEDTQTEEADSNAGDIGHWWGNKRIAFSTYLSAARYVGAHQHIKFDRVLLNDGNAYEPYTGIFRPEHHTKSEAFFQTTNSMPPKPYNDPHRATYASKIFEDPVKAHIIEQKPYEDPLRPKSQKWQPKKWEYKSKPFTSFYEFKPSHIDPLTGKPYRKYRRKQDTEDKQEPEMETQEGEPQAKSKPKLNPTALFPLSLGSPVGSVKRSLYIMENLRY